MDEERVFSLSYEQLTRIAKKYPSMWAGQPDRQEHQ